MDENGKLLISYAYNAFGEQISAVTIQGAQKSTTNRFLYAGEQYDETSGLYYLRARHYDVRAGRFTQEDTYLGYGSAVDNVAKRDAYHHMNAKGYEPAVLDKSSSSAEAIRGREQMLIDYYGGAQSTGGTSGNAINGISVNNPKGSVYMDAARGEFEILE